MAKNKNFELHVQRFKEWMKVKGWSGRTIEDYFSEIKLFFGYLEEETSVKNIQDIDTKTLTGYQVFLYHKKNKQGRRLALASQHKKLTVVRSFFRFLYETDVIIYDPSAAIKLPKKKKYLPRNVMSEQQVETLLNQPDIKTTLGFRDRTILEVFYSTGIRNEELRNLTIYDVDFNLMQLTVREGKNAKDRVVPLGEIAADYLQEYLLTVRPKLCGNGNENILFVSKNGFKITEANLITMFCKYVKKAELKGNYTPHSMRHSCATHMLKHGADIRYIQELLGHASVATTQIYTKVEVTDLKNMHRRFHPREKVD